MNTITLTITLHPGGGIQVSGPLNDAIMCLGLLEIAKQTVLNTNRKERPSIQPVTLMPSFPSPDQEAKG